MKLPIKLAVLEKYNDQQRENWYEITHQISMYLTPESYEWQFSDKNY